MPHVLPLFDGPVYGTPLTLALVEPKLEEHGIDAGDRLAAGAAARHASPSARSRSSSSASRTACPTAWRWPFTRRSASIVHTGDFKIDQTPIDGEHFDLHRFAELGAQGVLALFADSTNIDRQGFTGSEIEVIDAFEEIFTSTDRQAGRRGVRVEHLPDADPRRPGGAVRAQGGVRRPRHGAELGDRAAARLPAHAGRRADPRHRRRRTTRRRTCCASRPARRASRRRRCRASRSTITATSSSGPTTRSCFSARAIPGQREGDRPRR